jgi:hypothetical protein
MELENAKKIHSIYFPGVAFPRWTIDAYHWETHAFDSVKVYYHSEDSIDDVKLLMTQREPCNIGMKRLYNKELLKREFGYEQGAYQLSTAEKCMPNLAVYTHATVNLKNIPMKAHVINLVGAAFDHPHQPDFIYFHDRPLEDIVIFYRKMWSLALQAMIQSPCTKLQIYNVGGGAFAPAFYNFIMDIFEPAMKPLLPLFERHGFAVIGYDWTTHKFTGGFIPGCLEHAELETTMFVNAWDPWSLIGNGNERDGSLDGYWGRCSNMAVLGWLPTNPKMKFVPVNTGL